MPAARRKRNLLPSLRKNAKVPLPVFGGFYKCFHFAIIAAIAGAAFGIYVLVKKYVDSKRVVIGNDAENYVSCSCCDDTFVTETTVA